METPEKGTKLTELVAGMLHDDCSDFGSNLLPHAIKDGFFSVYDERCTRCQIAAALPAHDAAIRREALEEAAKLARELMRRNRECPHGEEPDYCDCCLHDQQKNIAKIPDAIRALAAQPEDTGAPAEPDAPQDDATRRAVLQARLDEANLAYKTVAEDFTTYLASLEIPKFNPYSKEQYAAVEAALGVVIHSCKFSWELRVKELEGLLAQPPAARKEGE